MLKPGRDLTSVFFMCLDKEVLIYADCALNANPDSTLLSEIAVRASDVAEQVGLRPRVAMLSYATGDSNKGPEIEKVGDAIVQISALLGPTKLCGARKPLVGELSHESCAHSLGNCRRKTRAEKETEGTNFWTHPI